DPADVARVVQGAFQALLRTGSKDLLDCGVVLTNILRGIERALANEQVNPNADLQHGKLRESSTKPSSSLWRREYIARRAGNKYVSSPNPRSRANEASFDGSSDELMTALRSYLTHLRSFKRDEYGYDEDIAVERVFGAMLRPIAADVLELKGGPAVCKTFSAFVGEVSKKARVGSIFLLRLSKVI
ncbi:hypothetical protein FS837_004817, partial [Tulasnella sp. UAMH 9824]